jgi:hypothetical protein
LDGIKDHRPVIHGKQMLVGDAREWIEAGTPPSGKHDTFHGQVSPAIHSPALKFVRLKSLKVLYVTPKLTS